MRISAMLFGSAAALAMAGPAAAELFQVGDAGLDGFLSIDLTSTGAAAASGQGFYDPIGPIEGASTIFESFIAFGSVGSGFAELGDLAEGASFSSVSDAQGISGFSIGNLSFTLTQTLTQSIDPETAMAAGATLTQSLRIANAGTATEEFSLRRYLDGDLNFDGTIADAGGVIRLAGTRTLFETDSLEAGGEQVGAAATFVGVNAAGGAIPMAGSFEIAAYSGLRSRVLGGVQLSDTVAGDEDADGFIDSAYDVTLALQNDFSIAAGDSATYVTQTIWGAAAPTRAGETEEFAVLPGTTVIDPETDAPTFVFELPPGAVAERETLFFDPFVSTGYVYEVTNAEFHSVTAPSLAAVNDPDGYALSFNGISVSIMAGQEVVFSDHGMAPVTSFTLTGIDPALMLDPEDGTAFVTGLSFQNMVPGESLQVTQTAMTVFVPDAEVPLPAPALLSLTGLLGLWGVSRRRGAA